MQRHTAPWVWCVACCSVLLLLFSSVAQAGHLHHLAPVPTTHGAGWQSTAPSADDPGSDCPLCILGGTALPRQAPILQPVPVTFVRTIAQAADSPAPAPPHFPQFTRPPPAA